MVPDGSPVSAPICSPYISCAGFSDRAPSAARVGWVIWASDHQGSYVPRCSLPKAQVEKKGTAMILRRRGGRAVWWPPHGVMRTCVVGRDDRTVVASALLDSPDRRVLLRPGGGLDVSVEFRPQASGGAGRE